MSDFYVRLGGLPETAAAHLLEPEANLFTGEPAFKKAFGDITPLESDLLRIGAAIFAADRGTERGTAENIQRTISLSIPVAHFNQLHSLTALLERVLRKLSDDRWKIAFRPAVSPLETKSFSQVGGSTLLFSGGLDSLAAAVEFGKQMSPLDLVSHTTKNSVTSSSQKKLVAELKAHGYKLVHRQFFVSSDDSPPGGFDHDIENSQRTRSFVFLILGALVARRTGRSTLLMLAENGQMAIHLPLTTGRIGALSTHTAHPDVLALMQSFLSSALSYPLIIQNPYLYRTKAETIAPIVSKVPAAIPLSTSCWRNTKIKGNATHCGACIPCYVRRIALEQFGKDPTLYSEDPWVKPIAQMTEDDDGRRNLVDLAEFIKHFEKETDDGLLHVFPELFSSNLIASDAVAMYRRFAHEARTVLMKYPGIASVLL